MKQASSDIIWFCRQLQQAEQTISLALEKAEEFSEDDKAIGLTRKTLCLPKDH